MEDMLSQRFVGMDELRRTLGKVLDALHDDRHQLVITRQGKPAAVMLDVETYLEVQEALREFSDPEYLTQLIEARQEIRRGDGVDAEEAFRRRGL